MAKLPNTASKAERLAAHKAKMEWKADNRIQFHAQIRRPKSDTFGANINRRTGKPHEHKREIARRLARKAA